MRVHWVPMLLGSAITGALAINTSMLDAMKAEHISMDDDDQVWVPAFNDESPPYSGVRVPRTDWAVACSSEEQDYECKNAIDGKSTTAWHSQSTTSQEYTITVDLGRPDYHVSSVVILPPIGTETEGLILEHKIFLSSDASDWKGPVAYGMWPSTNRQRMSAFEPTPARYVKLVASTKDAEQSWVGISELNIYATPFTITQDPRRGVWGPTVDFPVVPVAGAQEPSGNIILWSSWASDQFHSTPGGQTAMSRWNPLTHTVSKRVVTNTQHDMFCPGISIDGTGMMVVTGGNDASETSLYDATKDTWTKGPEMHLRRGYQASTTLSDGRVFVIGGSWAGGSITNKNGEVYNPTTQKWTMLPGADVEPMLTQDMEGRWRADNHGWLFGWKNESIFQAGPSRNMNWYFVEDEGSYIKAGRRGNDDDSMSGNAVMFDAVNGKILTLGGSLDYDKSYATDAAHIITLGAPGEKPTVKLAAKTGKMHAERVFHTSVVLPDGTVFIAGGQTFGIAFNEDNVQFTPELYDPVSDSFTQLQTNNIIRVYHTLSILMPDGRVLNGGGGLCGNCSSNHYDAQIFTPPYLLTDSGELRPRPEITSSVPPAVEVGKTITFETKDDIKSASLLRLCSATHTVNTDQRRIPLELSRSTGDYDHKYTVTVPADPGIAIPGYWMLFVMDHHGVPSIAKFIMVTVSNTKTLEPPETSHVESADEDCKHESTKWYWQSWKPELIRQMSRRG
ncbi:hypothetical protein BDV28DRAFT_126109 [Aspergillus coremiiformis]|uniref:F5/8 type C domain-containing protein n=1 Tax=Aspergillus coremiiformis TaxID=138285 RepID=A0A5N6ZHP2_9EURO|nr:hypothetical protein BDV28DRAFT_126109 [Aspergillus coremiiformis]